jgi:hypothetical protein
VQRDNCGVFVLEHGQPNGPVTTSSCSITLSAIDYPSMQDPTLFGLTEVKRKIDAAIKKHHGK